ncbi:unnamed protein product [Paramecium sonneborni]|uniref:Uncharacterized protein n=1 Tax=Paramecium sonneborni TaxID=65129 RepID=A0A8S1KZT3_9CILI|nr:unnamed protein product [Paramecium sonneborni]
MIYKNDIIKILQKDYDDGQYVDNVLIIIAKQISMDLGQVKESMHTNSQIKSGVLKKWSLITL